MTAKRHEPGLSVENARSMLRTAGLRSTSCRIAVLRCLADAGAPVSHAEVAEALEPQGFDNSTIFRSLTEFAEMGMAHRMELGDHTWRFELAGADGEQGSDHAHFVCVDCGKVKCAEEISVKITPERGRKRTALGDVTEILLKGHCPDCR